MLMKTKSASPPKAPSPPSWTIELRESERFVLVTTAGLFTLQTFKDMVPAALGAGSAQGITRYVFDDRLMHPRLATSEIYKLPETFERLGWKRGMRVAVVYAPDHRSAADFQFFANLAVARAFQYCLFVELKPAIAWVVAAE